MIAYIVELEMETALRGEYVAWLHEHMRQMLALPGFVDAEVLERLEPAAPADHLVLTVHYRLRDRAAWEGYLDDHAARMRAAGLARFGDRVRATRRVLETL